MAAPGRFGAGGLRACDTMFPMTLRSAFFFGFYFWFSVPGGREANA
jgi:hypothetical protein